MLSIGGLSEFGLAKLVAQFGSRRLIGFLNSLGFSGLDKWGLA